MDEDLRLVLPTAEYKDEIAAYRQEFLDAGDSMDGTGPLRRMADITEWLAITERFRHEDTVPLVRHRFNEFLKKYGGHIGYSVRPSERGKGYASWMLNAVKPFCRSIGLDAIMVSCLTANDKSRRVILKNGGIYDATVHEPIDNLDLERYWIDLSEKI